MKNLPSALARKGWSRPELRTSMDILAHAEAAKSPSMRFVEQAAFWVALLISIVGNLIISVVMVPFLLLLDGLGLYATVAIIGVTFGAVFNVLIHYTEELGEGQHIIAGAFIPALALINIALITHFSNKLEILLQLGTPAHSPFGIGATYVAAFIMPYLFKHFSHVKQKKS